MTPQLIQLLCLGLTQLPEVRDVRTKIALLEAAAPHLPEDLQHAAQVTAASLKLSEDAQLKLFDLLNS